MRKLWSRLDRLSLRLFVVLSRVGCLPALLLALTASACASIPTAPSVPVSHEEPIASADAARTPTAARSACRLELVEVCSPFLTDRGICYDDATRWVRLLAEGCQLPDITWSLTPSGAEIGAWQPGSGIAWVRGNCGEYRVQADASKVTLTIVVSLPGPLCDGRQQ